MKEIKNKQISYVVSERQRERVQRLAEHNDFSSVSNFLDTLIDDYAREHEYSLYLEYKRVIDLLFDKIEMHGHITMYDEMTGNSKETPEEAEMYKLLDVAYSLLIKADAMLNDEKNYVVIDENHPLFEGKVYERYKHDLSKIDLKFIEKIAAK